MNIEIPPVISIIVPVLNESEIIAQTAAHLMDACHGFNAEIIVVDADPAGSTICHVNTKQVRTLVAPRGRARQMNAGAEAARGAVMLFVHADTRLPAGAIREVIRVCRRPAVAGGAFFLGIDSEKPVFRLIESLANLRCRFTRIPYGDQAVFIKKRIFRSIGGYAGIPLMEDIEIMQRLKQNRLKIVLIQNRVDTSCRRWEKEGIVYGIVRNTLLSCLYYAGVKPLVLKRFYT